MAKKKEKLVKGIIAVTNADKDEYYRLQESFKGEVVDKSIRFPKKLGVEHPFNFNKMEKIYKRVSIVSGAVNKYVDSIVGDFSIKAKNANSEAIILDFINNTEFNLQMRTWIRDAIIKGNGFLEIDLENSRVRVLNANHMFVERDDKGNVLGYKQFVGEFGKIGAGKMKKAEIIDFTPEQIAHLAVNVVGDDAYGTGFVWPNLRSIENYIQQNIDLTKLISRKAGAPYHVKLGVGGEAVNPNDIAEFKEETFIEILPSLRFTKGYLIVISTPHGKTGRFYQTFQDNSFEKYHVTAIECPVNTEEELEKERERLTDMEYQRMIMGEFVESMDSFFTRELVLSCIAEIPEKTSPEQSGRDYYLGVDVARYGLDETTFIIVEVDKNEKMEVILVRSTSKKPITNTVGRIIALNDIYGFKGVYVDESGVGGGAVDSLRESSVRIKDLDGQIGGVQFTLQNKEVIYKNLKIKMEQGKLKFPKHDKLIQQMSDLQYDFTESGHLKIHHPDNGHDDFPDALALAVAGVRKRKYKPLIG